MEKKLSHSTYIVQQLERRAPSPAGFVAHIEEVWGGVGCVFFK